MEAGSTYEGWSSESEEISIISIGFDFAFVGELASSRLGFGVALGGKRDVKDFSALLIMI